MEEKYAHLSKMTEADAPPADNIGTSRDKLSDYDFSQSYNNLHILK